MEKTILLCDQCDATEAVEVNIGIEGQVVRVDLCPECRKPIDTARSFGREVHTPLTSPRSEEALTYEQFLALEEGEG